MASQVSHIIYAHKFWEKYPLRDINKDEFILGSVFPDIRFIAEGIKRKDTHRRFKNLNLDFSGMTSFEAGWKFHSYCDMKREEVLNKYNFFSLDGASDFAGRSNKLLEDELTYNTYHNWEKLIHYFNNPPKLSTGIDIPLETFDLWYAILSRYIERRPDKRSMLNFESKTLSSPEKAMGIIEGVEKLRENKKVVEVLKKVQDEIV